MTMPASSAEAAPSKRHSRWLWSALILSLAVNLLFLGTMAGAAWKFHHGSPGGRFSANLAGFTASLSEARRHEVEQATAQERAALKPLRAEVREARQRARAILVAEPFDRQAFADAQARVLDSDMKVRAAAQKLFVALATVLTPEERATYVRGLPGGDGRGSPPPR
jgi:uncharacterized membrane protein